MGQKYEFGFLFVFSIVVALGLISFVSCILAESKKTKKEDVKLDGRVCYVPESGAFGFGIAALICAVLAQIIGSLFICCNFRHGNSFSKAKKRSILGTTLLVLSWISFGFAVMLLGVATSMSRRQPYGIGWLDHKCYLVKDGLYLGSGFLVLLATVAVIGSAILTIGKAQIEQNRKIHTQGG